MLPNNVYCKFYLQVAEFLKIMNTYQKNKLKLERDNLLKEHSLNLESLREKVYAHFKR